MERIIQLFLLCFLPICIKSFSFVKFPLKTMTNYKEHQLTKLHAVKNLSGKGNASKCSSCLGKGGVNCATCVGTGIDKKNGNVFERWTCAKCKGFGFLPCTACNSSSKGLTPEQTGER